MNLGARAMSSRKVVASGTRRPHDWTSRDWNWGYAVGAAHDAAFDLRNRLRTRKEREAWLADLPPWDEAQLCLALRIQRSCNTRRDPANFGQVLDSLAAGDFGSATEPNAALVAALAQRLEGCGDDPLSSQYEDEAQATLVKSLLALGFVEEGL